MTRSEVEAAIANILGVEVATALIKGRVALPQRLKLVAVKAFEEDLEPDENLDRVRDAMQGLSREGLLIFDPE